MKKTLYIMALLLCLPLAAGAEELVISDRYDKDSDGKSYHMVWNSPSSRFVYPEAQQLRESLAAGMKHGLTFWMYCEKPQSGKIRFTIEGSYGEICHFDVTMGFTGWRAVWIKFEDMFSRDGEFYVKKDRDFPMRLSICPDSESGECYLDRFAFPKNDIHFQVAPDAQLPYNNSHIGNRRLLWHWARLWEWEQYPQLHDIDPSESELADIQTLRKNLAAFFSKSLAPAANLESLQKKCDKSFPEIAKRPIVSNNEKTSSDSNLQEVIDLAWRYANIYIISKDRNALYRFFTLMDHLVEQGFAWGSGMGTNNHYGYQIRNLAPSMLLLENEIRESGRAESYFKTLEYWSGEAECRIPYDNNRDEMVDAWNTLNLPKLASALLQDTPAKQMAHLKAVTGWIQSSMRFTPGTIGGMKVDGTAFHHGGHYPSYWEGGLNSLGLYFTLVKGTCFAPDEQARNVVKKAALALCTYTNNCEWGVGIGGRHPEKTRVAKGAVEAIKALAELGDLTGSGKNSDPELMDAYQRMTVKKNNITGFYSYNYGAFGIWRTRGWMMTLKSMNTYTWGSEIYAAANRYGRYNSYGSLQLIGPDAKSIHEAGWDWNSLPGVTSVHLPYPQLNSPNPGTLMLRGSERFGGVAQHGENVGAMAFVYTEPARNNFVAGAHFVKSAFCFPDYAVAVGSDISNNSQFPTRTTLFQDDIAEDDQVYTDIETLRDGRSLVQDNFGNTYIIGKGALVKLGARINASPDNTGKKSGTGRFFIGWIEHGSAPSNASYDYMIAVQPTKKELGSYRKAQPYQVRELSARRHVVYDTISGIEATVDYENEVIYFKQATPEGGMILSVGTPDLGIETIEYTTLDPGHPIVRSVTLDGEWKMAEVVDNVQLNYNDNKTTVSVTCRDGASTTINLVK